MKRIALLLVAASACLMAMPSAAEARYAGGMNLYQYVGSGPNNAVDPSGLREAASAYEYVPDAMILRYGDPRDAGDETDSILASVMEMSGQSIVDQFLDRNGCPLCTSVGFVQIYRPFSRVTGWSYGIALYLEIMGNQDWHIDGGVPYGGRSIDPTKRLSQNLETGDQVLFTDTPNQPSGSYWFITTTTVHLFLQRFETHLVCLEGKEKGATYGGVSWGHRFSLKSGRDGDSIDDYVVSRWATRTDNPTARFQAFLRVNVVDPQDFYLPTM